MEANKKKKRLEILGGGYFEPELSILAGSDRVLQLDMLSTLIRKNFGKRPRGCNLLGKDWDNSLVNTLSCNDFNYVFLDKTQLVNQVKKKSMEFSVSMVEDMGHCIVVFPIHNYILQKALELTPEEFCSTISKIKGENTVLTLFFTPEFLLKLGFQWIEEFFKIISEDKIIETFTPAEIFNSFTSLPREIFFSSVGFKNKILDNPELSNLYSKMVYVQTISSQIKGDKYKKQGAFTELLKGEGYFASSDSRGIKKSYSSFIECEKLSRSSGIFFPSLNNTRFLFNFEKQYLYQGEDYNAYLQNNGGTIFEFDRIFPAWNYVNLSDEQFNKGLFADFFVAQKDFTEPVNERDIIFSFADCRFEDSDYSKENKNVLMTFRIKTSDFSVMIIKSFRFFNTKIVVDYELVNMGAEKINKKFMTNFNFSLICTEKLDHTMVSNNNFQLMDKNKIVSIFSDQKCSFVHYHKFNEEKYISTNVSVLWDIIDLEPGKSWINRVEFSCC